MTRILRVFALAAGTLVPVCLAFAADEHPSRQLQTGAGSREAGDTRQLVKLPAPLLQRELAGMRVRLETLGKLQQALSRGAYDIAAGLAERELGMSSAAMRRSDELAKYMPHGMREMAIELHRAASGFSVEAANAATSGDGRPVIAALSELMQRCVACHSAYRFR